MGLTLAPPATSGSILAADILPGMIDFRVRTSTTLIAQKAADVTQR